MARKSWNVAKIAKRTFDGIAQDNLNSSDAAVVTSRFFGSVRMTYTLCAFVAMIVHICMRNTLSFVILCMVKPQPQDAEAVLSNNTAATSESAMAQNLCDALGEPGTTNRIEQSGDMDWTRSQAMALQGTFYYGYIVTLPFAGHLADKFGGKLLFIHSITLQAVCFMLLPVFARMGYLAAVFILILQGLFAGCGNPALYQLFVVWAHPTERTALLSFAYGGYAVGALVAYPLSSYLCGFGWATAFYVIGSVSFCFGISCQWLVYNTLDQHPRISPAEQAYLQTTQPEPSTTSKVPWKSLLTSLPVNAFVLTHICHTYGMMVIMLMLPRFLKEAMNFTLREVGLLSSAPFLGSFVSKALSIISCNYIEKKPNVNLTKFRRFVYVSCNAVTCACIGTIIMADCQQKTLVVLMTVAIGVVTDLSFSGVYWPSLLYFAPSYAGLLSGIANCLASCCGFLAPIAIVLLVQNGTKAEWDLVMLTLIMFYALGAVAFGFFSSSKLQPWDARYEKSQTTTPENCTNTSFN